MKRAIYTSAHDAEAAFYEALEKADLDGMMAVWSDEDDIVCVHPGGPRLTGVTQVCESWRAIFAGGQTLRCQVDSQQSYSGMILVAHSVCERISIIGETRPPNPVIATNVYMRSSSGWRMVIHHASPSPSAAEPRGRRTPNILH